MKILISTLTTLTLCATLFGCGHMAVNSDGLKVKAAADNGDPKRAAVIQAYRQAVTGMKPLCELTKSCGCTWEGFKTNCDLVSACLNSGNCVKAPPEN